MSKKKNDDSEVINKKIDELELKLREAKDSELFNIHLKGESDKLFLLARNKLILWVSPIVLAILLLGYNIYDSNKKINN